MKLIEKIELHRLGALLGIYSKEAIQNLIQIVQVLPYYLFYTDKAVFRSYIHLVRLL